MQGKPWLYAVGGNGGLSLRRRSASIACLDAACWQRGQWEDAYFVESYQRLGYPVAGANAASSFSVERVTAAKPCGVHKVYNYQSCEEVERLLGGLERAYQELLDALPLASEPRTERGRMASAS